MISKEALRMFTKRIAENTNLISFCNKVISYNDILNNEEARNMFFVSLISADTLIDVHSCNETIETAEFILDHIDLMVLDDTTKKKVIKYMEYALDIDNKDKTQFEYDHLKDYR